MLNKNKSLTIFIIGILASIMILVTFVSLGETKYSTTGTNTSTLAWISFLISFVFMGIIYTILLILFSTHNKFKKTPLTLLLTTLMISLVIAFSVAVMDLFYNIPLDIYARIFIMIALSISIFILIILMQDFNTKFMMASIADNRADEWEYSNYLKLFLNRVSIEHKKDHTILKYKKKNIISIFIPENSYEREIHLSGDLKNQVVKKIEDILSENEIGILVFLSNNIPKVLGENKNIKLVKQNDLFKFIKKMKEKNND